MSDKQYIYAVARIRANELSLLNNAFIDQLIGAKSYDECIRLLSEHGWGDGTDRTAAGMLACERDKTWNLIAELVKDMKPFDVFLYRNDFHNLKAAIKKTASGKERDGIYIDHGTIEPKRIKEAVQAREFENLPENMRAAAEEALNVLLHTGDGQLCDIIVDRAALEAIYKAAGESDNSVIRLYGELTVVTADLKSAVRCQRMKKDRQFIDRCLVPCRTLDIRRLAAAATEDDDAISEYLRNTDYSEGADKLKESPSAFECWSDNLIIRAIKPELYHPFTIGPLAAYILARENEIKTVRIILSGKNNGFSEDKIRERVREMYV